MSEVKMTDAELISTVAEKVMGWKWRKYCGSSSRYRVIDESVSDPRDIADPPSVAENNLGVLKSNGNGWNPLTDWNDTIIVVEAMRAKGWYFGIEPWHSSPMTVFVKFRYRENTGFGLTSTVKCDYGHEQRAILEAALAAMEASK